MNEFLGLFSLCFSLCFVLDGLSTAAASKVSFLYIVTRIGYPLFIACAQLWFLLSGVLD